MKIKITNKLTLSEVPRALEAELRNRLSFENPKWIENQKHGFWNGETPRVLRFYGENPDGCMVAPRGFARKLISFGERHGVRPDIQDLRRTLPGANFTFQSELTPFQAKAVKDILSRDFGTLSAPTGSGKTIMALAAIAERRQPVLIVVHTKELLNQWIERIGRFLGVPAEQIGAIGAGEKRVGGRVTVALELLTGDLTDAQRQAVLKRLNLRKVKVLVATGQLIGEGFDLPSLSTLFLAAPMRFDGRVRQYLGRGKNSMRHMLYARELQCFQKRRKKSGWISGNWTLGSIGISISSAPPLVKSLLKFERPFTNA